MARKDAAVLEQFLHQLPQVDRYILLLYYADGLTIREIALVLELGETRVESRLATLRAQAGIALDEALEGTGRVEPSDTAYGMPAIV